MKISHLVPAGIAALVLLSSTNAFAVLRIVEEAFESSSAETRIPADVGGAMVMRRCEECAAMTLRITVKTRFFVDEQPVSQAEFRRAANRGTYGMTVHYDPKSLDVTRIVMDVH